MSEKVWIITPWKKSGIYTIEDSINGKKYRYQKTAKNIADSNPLWRNDTVIRSVTDSKPDRVLKEEIEYFRNYNQVI